MQKKKIIIPSYIEIELCVILGFGLHRGYLCFKRQYTIELKLGGGNKP